MKAYIQDLCGDENSVDIDCAILQCMLQDAMFKALMGEKFGSVPSNSGGNLTSFTLPHPVKYVTASYRLED